MPLAYCMQIACPAVPLPSQRLLSLHLNTQHTLLPPLPSLTSALVNFSSALNITGASSTPLSASSLKALTSHALKYQSQTLLKSTPGRLYKLLIPPEKTASYILTEPRPIARLRARIRLNRPSFNASLFKRRLASTPKYPHCQSAEDIEHVLLECHAYDPAPHRLINALSSFVHPTSDASWWLLVVPCICAVTGEVPVTSEPSSRIFSLHQRRCNCMRPVSALYCIAAQIPPLFFRVDVGSVNIVHY